MPNMLDPAREAVRRKKLSVAMKGRVFTDAHRRHIAEARKGRFNRNIVQKYNKMDLTEPEKAWLACAIDGEGSIRFVHKIYEYPSGVKYPIHTRSVELFNSDRRFLEYTAQLLNEPIDVIKLAKPHKGGKPIYRIRVRKSLKLYDLLTQIRNYLIIKRDKADEICQFLQMRFNL